MNQLLFLSYKYTILPLLSVYSYSKFVKRHLIHEYYKPKFIIWMSLTYLYLFEMLKKIIFSIYNTY